MKFLSHGVKHSMWTSFEKGTWRYDFWSHLRLMGVTDIFLCFPAHSPHSFNLPSARRWTVWTALPLAYSWVCWRGSTSNKSAGWRRRKPRYLFSWVSPCGVAKGWLCPSTKALAPFKWPTLYISPCLWVLLIASCLQSWTKYHCL